MSAPDLDRCPSCQAPHGPGEAICWMCGFRLWMDGGSTPAAKASPASKPEPKPAPKPAPVYTAPKSILPAVETRWTQPVLIVAFILILIGLPLGRGQGTVLLWLGLLPALFVTALAGFRPTPGEPLSAREKLERFITKLASVLAVMILTAVAIAIALAAVCFGILAVMK
jgi:hypothetical protein